MDILLSVYNLLPLNKENPSPTTYLTSTDVHASVYPNPHIAVNSTTSGWRAYTILMFMFGFIWGWVNFLMCGACMGIILESKIKARWLVIMGLSPVAIILVLGPFLSPWVGRAVVQNVSLKILPDTSII